MYMLLWIFFVYAFLGWCTEVSFAALTSGKFVNRGFLNGPVCPIYGCGVVIVLFFLEPLRENTLLLFLGSVVLTSVLEWLTGFVLERIFHQRWWDYSHEPFNLGGYICLRFSIAWGLACLLVVDVIHPTIHWLITCIPHTLGLVLLVVFSAVMVVDLAATVRTIARINRQLTQLDELAGRIKSLSNELGESLAERVLDAAEKGGELRDNLEDVKDSLAQRRDELQDGLEDVKDALVQRRDELQDGLEDVKDALAQRRDDLQDGLEDVKDALAQRRMQRQMDQFQRQEQRQQDLEELRRRLEEALDRPIFGQRRLMRAFPRMRSTTHTQALERLRQWMEEHGR